MSISREGREGTKSRERSQWRVDKYSVSRNGKSVRLSYERLHQESADVWSGIETGVVSTPRPSPIPGSLFGEAAHPGGDLSTEERRVISELLDNSQTRSRLQSWPAGSGSRIQLQCCLKCRIRNISVESFRAKSTSF